MMAGRGQTILELEAWGPYDADARATVREYLAPWQLADAIRAVRGSDVPFHRSQLVAGCHGSHSRRRRYQTTGKGIEVTVDPYEDAARSGLIRWGTLYAIVRGLLEARPDAADDLITAMRASALHQRTFVSCPSGRGSTDAARQAWGRDHGDPYYERARELDAVVRSAVDALWAPPATAESEPVGQLDLLALLQATS